ncbi:hypothetical protein JCM21900_000215 [Sporobolomyces salmonicolor]
MHALTSLLPAPLASLAANPLNLVLVLVLVYLVLSLLPSTPLPPTHPLPSSPSSYNWRPASHPPALLWRQWTPAELKGYDGTEQGEERGRILFAIRRKVYDVTTGRDFYGPGGPYAIFAGRDASRGLAKQSFEPEMLSPLEEPIDALEDLTQSEWDNLRDWEGHFNNKYIQCGDYVEAR